VIRRREFIGTLGATAAWPLAARAQQPAMPVIGFLNGQSPGEYAPFLTAFHRGLAEEGFLDGRNVAVEYRWAEGHNDRLPALAADLVSHRVTGIAATGATAAVVAAMRQRRFRLYSSPAAIQLNLASSPVSIDPGAMSPVSVFFLTHWRGSNWSCCAR